MSQENNYKMLERRRSYINPPESQYQENIILDKISSIRLEDVKTIEQLKDIELYKEYVQWDFINNQLYNKGNILMNINRRKMEERVKVKQELTNTLQMWFIFINENFNSVPKYEYYSILPNISLEHPAAQFLRSAIIKKRFVTEDKANEKIEEILKFIAINHSNVIPFEFTEPLYLEYNNTRKIIVVNKFQSPEVPRVELLVKNGGIVSTARMLLRYESLGNGSYQWCQPNEVYRVLHNKFNVRYEGFASPMSSHFIEYENAHFCSLFPETDRVFGSLGNFFDVDLHVHQGGWSLSPPFLNDLMKNVADRIIRVLNEGCKCYFFCTFPWWEDDEGWNTLNNSTHLLERFDLRSGKFILQDAYGNKFSPKMNINMFVMGKLPKDVSRLVELGNILIFNNDEALPSESPW